MGPDFKRSIGVLPEGLALFDDLTVEEHLSLHEHGTIIAERYRWQNLIA